MNRLLLVAVVCAVLAFAYAPAAFAQDYDVGSSYSYTGVGSYAPAGDTSGIAPVDTGGGVGSSYSYTGVGSYAPAGDTSGIAAGTNYGSVTGTGDSSDTGGLTGSAAQTYTTGATPSSGSSFLSSLTQGVVNALFGPSQPQTIVLPSNSSPLISTGFPSTGVLGGLTSAGTGGVTGTFAQIVGNSSSGLIGLLNSVIVPLIIALSFLVFVYGVVRYFFLQVGSETAREQGRQFMIWGILGLALMFSLWGVINLLLSTFGIAST